MTGIQPGALLEDSLMLAAATEQAEAARWTDMHELLALNAELTHGVLRAVIASGGGKPPDPLELPRPGRPDPNAPVVMRPSEFGKLLAGGGA